MPKAEFVREKKIKDAMAKLFSGVSAVPALETMALDLITEFGGSRLFAKEFKKQYTATDSSMVKSKMLESVLYLVRLTSAKRTASSLDEFSYEELVAIAGETMKSFADESVEVANASEAETCRR